MSELFQLFLPTELNFRFMNNEVSNFGRVKSLSRTFQIRKNATMNLQERILKPVNLGNGYFRVTLSKNNIPSRVFVHRIVASAFLPNPYNLPVVNHKDEQPSNNRADNLEWCSQKYNCNYGTRTERISKKNIGKKLTILRSSRKFQYIVSVSLTNGDVKLYDSLNDAEKEGFLHSNVSKCCNNRFNRPNNNIYKGYKWFYKKDYDALTQEGKEHL